MEPAFYLACLDGEHDRKQSRVQHHPRLLQPDGGVGDRPRDQTADPPSERLRTGRAGARQLRGVDLFLVHLHGGTAAIRHE